jgi:hypothetical protein
MASILDQLLRNDDGIGFKLIPHIEEAAMKYVVHNTVMATRVKVMTDMTGWNVRKVSEYIRGRRAQDLAEDTEIPNTNIMRARKTIIEPYEVGDMYRITDRRTETDLESIVSDTVSHLGLGISERVEMDLISVASEVFRGGTLGATGTDYSLNLMLQAATLFRARARHGALYHVVHPYQAHTVMEKLIDYSNVAPLGFRDQAASRLEGTSDLRSFQLPTFGITDLSISELLPRHFDFKLVLNGDGGTFRLQLGDGYETSGAAQNITGAITVSATPATTVANVLAAINALPLAVRKGTWGVTGAANDNITITMPSGVYFSDPDNLRIANKYDDDVAVMGQLGVTLQKSAYDLVTSGGGDPTGADDMNGNPVGVELYERTGGYAKSLLFKPDAIAWDIRKGVKSHFDTVHQGRTAEYAGYMVYGVEQWSPENGMYILSKAQSPSAV